MNHKARHLLLHFGLPKTGTSAIQRTLFDHRGELLKDHDTLYPGPYESHFFFHGLFAEHPESLFRIQMLGLENRKAIDDFLENYRQGILNEINQTRPSQIIISSEYFRDMSENELKAMHAFMKTIAEEVTLFAYIRDPWGWALSSLQEQIMTGYRRREGRPSYSLPLREILAKFESAFGVRAIMAPYLNQPGFNAAVDFCQRFGLTSLEPAARLNTNIRSSMKREAACVMLELNQLFPVFDEDNGFIQDPARDLMREAISNSPLSITPLHISTRSAREVYENSLSHIQLLEEQYFGGRKPFTEYYHLLRTTDSDDTLSISLLSPEQLSEYLLTCMHVLGERAHESHRSAQDLLIIKSNLENTLLHLENTLLQARIDKAGLEEELSKIKRSKSYRMALAFKQLYAKLIPPNSRRDRFLHRLTESIFNRFVNP